MLSLRLESTPDGDERLVLRFGDWEHVCDEYYLALDRGIAPGDGSATKVRRVLARLLEQWRNVLSEAQATCDVFLPFDFADQCTAWLRAHVTLHDVTLQPGWSDLEGWSFFPSDITAHVRCLTDFEPLANVRPITADRADWLTLIDDSLEAANQEGPCGPLTDPTPIFELFRGSYGAELLTAAVAHFNLFAALSGEPLSFEELREHLELAPRAANVLLTALRAMGLLSVDDAGYLTLTPLAREHLVPGRIYDVGDYVGLAASSPGVLAMVERLESNRPAGLDEGGAGTAFIYREGSASAMEEADLARHFTLALAGRAKNVAPRLARAARLEGATHLLDVAGGTGLYALACLERHPELRAVVLDRPEVLKVAAEFQRASSAGDRLHLLAGDMFTAPLPRADVILLSNVLHDWDIPDCRRLIARCAEALPRGGRLLIHDVFLSDALDGPLPIALYSAALFTLTEGRAYSAAEYRDWLNDAGLSVTGPTPTLIHCGLLTGTKR